MTDQERKAMEMALEWMEATHHTAMTTYADEWYEKHCKVESELRQALAQPEQEHESRITSLEIRVAKLEKPITEHEKQLMAGQRSLLRTTTPSKPWVSLTDEEIGLLSTHNTFSGMHPDYLRECFRAIEAKLKEKNNG